MEQFAAKLLCLEITASNQISPHLGGGGCSANRSPRSNRPAHGFTQTYRGTGRRTLASA